MKIKITSLLAFFSLLGFIVYAANDGRNSTPDYSHLVVKSTTLKSTTTVADNELKGKEIAEISSANIPSQIPLVEE